LIRVGDFVIPEEWKPSARRIYHPHKLQVAAYCVLIEEKFQVRPPHGVVVLAGGERVEVPFTDELRREVLTIAEKIREHRRKLEEEIPAKDSGVTVHQGAGERKFC